MHFIDVCVASAFSKNNRGGNQAGVVLQGASLNRKEKMRTAHQLGYSETAFLSQSELADYKLEYFTPTGEVPLCGHATIAAFVVLNYFGQLKKCEYTIETKSGILSIAVKDGGVIFMQQNTPEFYETLELADVVDCLGFNADTAPGNLPVQIVSIRGEAKSVCV
ncbi:PhzF family phenazine biosynthesis protein [Hungatella hathewayi]|uniref:PhzF family phenazine biosynthesis protein n=1 Tax=Hungatella hathewayi TaxID=154046 RepID=UPI0026DD6DDD|nr:PhzF family phenazine biosynthesis isomerase [Hungatella hathewayi]